ncbi:MULTISPECIES: alcohol dehydrogenase catalytic domain-containing protein [unclassified Novosphingobium]|uniref:alcohol dehydrogenase catalytic domain-containing protein n=1 Tax=unclassified Novosphingobium TaxID=2644732 RepID=UPI00135C5581|nr:MULTISPECIES: alcohol dehydrogenase catalytic domain-containing protein [unclassified Novosphingobium]
MKAAIYPGQGKPIVIETIADPQPGPGELLIRVDRCGICGTDLSMTRGGAWDFGNGVQFGHEYAGTVAEVGKGVTGWKVGDPLAVLPSVACGSCEICTAHGNNVLCRESTVTASVGFAELAKVPVSVATRLPSTLSMADGALIEPMAISLYGAQMARIRPGERVLVLGGGTVALYAIYWARRLGAGRIVAMSRSSRRKDLCIEMGADAFVAFGDNEVGEVVEALGGAPQVVLECVGAEGMLGRSVLHAAAFGRIVSLGFCTSPDPVIPGMASYKCVSMHFAVGYSMREFLTIAQMLDRDSIHGGGHADPKAIVSGRVGLADLPAMFENLRGPNAETKVHVHCNGL